MDHAESLHRLSEEVFQHPLVLLACFAFQACSFNTRRRPDEGRTRSTRGLDAGRLHDFATERFPVSVLVTYTCRGAVRWPRG
jgi:hypothetical protein